MSINSILSTASQGIQQANKNASQAAHQIASQSIEDSSTQGLKSDDLVNSLVALNQAEIAVKANAKVLQTAADMVGAILDVKA